MTRFLFRRLVDTLGCMRRYPDVLVVLPRVLGRAEEVLGEAVRCEALAGRGAWATLRLDGAEGPRAVLKIVSPRRARIAARINDPNPFYANETPQERWARERDLHKTLGPDGLVPPLLDAGENYLLIGYVSGFSLVERKVAPVEELVDIIGRVLKDLSRLHAKGFTHGDARPDNIIIAEGHSVFIDFEHLIDPDRPLIEQRALDWLRFFNHLHYFRSDLFDGDAAPLLEQIHRAVDPETLRQVLSLADQVPYILPPLLLERLGAMVA